jgi:hypothetical protein
LNTRNDLMFWQRAFAVLFVACVAAFTWRFPLGQLWLAIGFGVYAVVLLKFPRVWLIIVPAAMPVLDLATFSGWYFFDEFDALVLLTLAVLLWGQRLRQEDFRFGWPVAIVLSVLMLSYIVSTAIVFTPWPVIDGNAFASYYSPFNAARVAKGFVWPLLLLPYLNLSIRETSRTGRYLAGGLLLGLFGVCVVGLYEHWLFAGLFNFHHSYRIVGPFSSMHTGDGHIDLWLTVTIPLIVAPFIQRSNLGWRLMALGLGGMAFYVLLATASRGPFLATAAAFLAMLGLFALIWARRGRFWRTLLVYPMFAGLLAVVALPFIVPTEVGSRFKRTAEDFQKRVTHWQEALSMRDPGRRTRLFGVGLGTFPETYARHHVIARYSFDRAGRQRYLTLRSGDNLYMGQRIDAQPDTSYRLSFTYRTRDARARLTVAICENWLIHSRRCSWNSYRLPPTGGSWAQHEATVKIEETGRPRGRIGYLSKQPLWLTLHTSAAKQGLSLDNIAFVPTSGRNLIKNGNFSGNHDHWFWAVDNHLPWHTKNMAVNVLFDQGWLGLVGVVLLFGLGMVSLGRAMWAGYAVAIPWAGAMIGYLINAAVVSPFDQPRLAMLFYLLCLFCILQFLRGWTPLRD